MVVTEYCQIFNSHLVSPSFSLFSPSPNIYIKESISDIEGEKMNEKRFIVIMICVLFTVPVMAVGNGEHSAIKVSYRFNEPTIEKLKIGEEVYDVVTMEGTAINGKVGEPALPAKGAYILLPQNTNVKSIEVLPGKKISLGTGYKVMPIGKSIPIINKEDYISSSNIPSPNKEIYNSNEEIPGKLFTEVGVYNFRGYKILVLMLHPVQYIPSESSLFYYEELTVSVKLIEDENANKLYRGLYRDKIEVMKKVDNPDVANTYKGKNEACSDEYDLLIITTNSLQKEFEKLKECHDNRGVRTIIKTLSEIGDTAEEIRDYIRNAYMNMGIDYVLIGGDVDVVPAKMLWVSGLDENIYPYDDYMPSDIYYACLDGTFNYDGDSKWGEPTDGDGGKDVDLLAEVYVGRACVGNRKEANNFVTKTVAYIEMGADDYFKEVCLAGEYLGDYGIASFAGNYLDQFINGSDADGYTTVGIPADEYHIITLYDRDSWWSAADIMEYINNGVHFINHLGHSNMVYNMKMITDDVEQLQNTKYCFIYSQGCYAGAIDYEDCIAEYHTVKTKHSAFAVIMNARYGFFWSFSTDGDSQRYHREFWDAVFGENIITIGGANQDSKEDNLYLINRSMMRWCYYQLNLLGDPAVALRISNPPEKPAKPSGTGRIKPNTPYEYTAVTQDVDGDQIYYKWDWGDGSYSDWLGPYNSGEVINASHTWEKRGIYEIRVKAKDVHGFESEWSEPLAISVPYRFDGKWNIFKIIFEWLKEIFERSMFSMF